MTDRQTFTQEMERQFGSEEALGVTIRLQSGETVTAAEYDFRCANLPKDQRPGGESLLPDGGSAVCCTDYASWIYKRLPGRVKIYGFSNDKNPTSRIAREVIHPGGHDFAIVDDRFIVDPWPRLVAGAFRQMVFDLTDPADAAIVADVYGPRECWEHMVVAETWTQAI